LENGKAPEIFNLVCDIGDMDRIAFPAISGHCLCYQGHTLQPVSQTAQREQSHRSGYFFQSDPGKNAG